MLYDDYEQDTDPKTNPSLHKMMDQVKEFCGDDKGNYDFIKLCSLLGEDVEKKENSARMKVETEYAQQTLPPALTETMQDKKPTDPIKPSEPAVQDLSIKQAIRKHYSLIPMSKDAIIKHLVPNDKFISTDDFRKTVIKDVKNVNQTALSDYILELAGEHKIIEKKTLRDSLFPDLAQGKDPRSINFEEQIDQVFSDLDIEQKNAIDKNKMTLGCKSLGLNLSPAELDTLFNQFKHHDSVFMDRNGFSKMVKYEYCQDISKNRIVSDRFDQLMPFIDPHRKGKVNEDQLRYLFAKLETVPTPEEIRALMIVCDAENREGGSGKISISKLREFVLQSRLSFDPRKEDLNNALIKIRSRLSTNLLEQYNCFKFMPSNYISSFTEDLYLSSNKCWPSSVFRPQLADSRTYYTNLDPPNSSEVRPQQKYSRYVKSSRNCLYFEIELQKATGVPIPDDSIVGYEAIVGREIRICLFEEEKNNYCCNCLNLECNWKMEYEDRIYFDLNKIDRENIVYIKIPDPEFYSKDKKYSLIFEFVNFVRKDNSHTTLAMSAGFARFNLADAVSDKSFSLDIVGGSPIREHSSTIAPEDVRHKRKGFIPKLVSLFEGKVKSQIHFKSKFLKLNPAKLTETEEELTLLPDMGVFHAPQTSILSFFRQCQGEDAFTVSGTVAIMIKMNTNLASEIYINSFCNLFCMPACSIILAHFWNVNIVKGLPKVTYEEKMRMLRTIFNYLYSTLTSLNFRFERHHPTDQLYGDIKAMNERAALLKDGLAAIWSRIQDAFPQKKPVVPKFIDKISTLETPKFEERHSTFNIQELMDEDFDIQIA